MLTKGALIEYTTNDIPLLLGFEFQTRKALPSAAM